MTRICALAYVELSLALSARCGPKRPCAVCREFARAQEMQRRLVLGGPLPIGHQLTASLVVSRRLLADGRYELAPAECGDVFEQHRRRQPDEMTTREAAMSAAQSAHYLGISRATFYRHVVKDGVPSYAIGRRRLWKRCDLDLWMGRRRQHLLAELQAELPPGKPRSPGVALLLQEFRLRG